MSKWTLLLRLKDLGYMINDIMIRSLYHSQMSRMTPKWAEIETREESHLRQNPTINYKTCIYFPITLQWWQLHFSVLQTTENLGNMFNHHETNLTVQISSYSYKPAWFSLCNIYIYIYILITLINALHLIKWTYCTDILKAFQNTLLGLKPN